MQYHNCYENCAAGNNINIDFYDYENQRSKTQRFKNYPRLLQLTLLKAGKVVTTTVTQGTTTTTSTVQTDTTVFVTETQTISSKQTVTSPAPSGFIGVQDSIPGASYGGSGGQPPFKKRNVEERHVQLLEKRDCGKLKDPKTTM